MRLSHLNAGEQRNSFFAAEIYIMDIIRNLIIGKHIMKQVMIFIVLMLIMVLYPVLVKGQGQKTGLVWQWGIDTTAASPQSIVVTKNNDYIVSSNNFYTHHGLSSFDRHGNLLWHTESNVCQMMDMNLNNNFLALNYFDNIITMFDYNGDTIKNIAPPINAENLKWAGYISKDAQHYYVSYYDSLGDNCSIIVYNNEVQYVGSFTIAINRQDAFYGLVPIDGYIYLSKSGYGTGQQSNVVSDIYKYDQSGNMIWKKHLLDRTDMRLALSPDGQLYMGAFNFSTPIRPFMSWEFSKIDTAGNFIWDKLWFDEYPDTVNIAVWPKDFKAIPGGGCLISGGATKLGLNTSYGYDENNVEPVIVGFSDQGEKFLEVRYNSFPSDQVGKFYAIAWDAEKYLIASGLVNSYKPPLLYSQILYKYSISGVTGIEKENSVTPTKFSLSQNYPNPFNPATMISFSLPKSGFVSLKIFNLLGQEVAVLVNEEKSAGTYNATFAANEFPSGVYLYTLQANGIAETKKMILMK